MISIVVPIYNAEKYLRECLDSVVKQLDDTMELLLINDGSKDNSLEICHEYARNDARIVVVDKKNSGVSDTRNIGIEKACGRYIVFIDADDRLVDGALAHISNALVKNGLPDVLIWGFSAVGKRKMFNDTHILNAHRDGFQPQDFLKHLVSIGNNERIIGVIWRCAFKRAVLNAHMVRFASHLRMSEDYKFLVDVALVARHINVLNKELYVYRTNNEAFTAKYKSNVHPDMAWINNWIRTDVLAMHPELETGLDCCCAETYVVAIQNLCNIGSPYGLRKRIQVAWEIRKEFQYSKSIKVASAQRKRLSAKRRLVYYMLRLYMEPVYLFLFSLKRKNMFKAENV